LRRAVFLTADANSAWPALPVGQLGIQAGRPVCVGEVTGDQHVAPVLIKQAQQRIEPTPLPASS
jgi:hypothetical protein